MSNPQDEQQQITDWFDNTYSKRGSWYLRPKKAYYIYLEVLKARPNEKLLDVACGLGRLLEASKDYEVIPYGVDISSVAISKAKKQFPDFDLRVANAEALPFDADTFDLMTCIGSLERMVNLDIVLHEMLRVGKTDCKFCFLVRNSESVNWQLFKKFLGFKNKKGHQDAKNLEDWKSIFNAAGFEITAIYPDQYPLMKSKRRNALWLKTIDYKTLIKSKDAIDKANEFLFLLRKQND